MPILEMQQDVTSQVQGVGRMMDVICVRSLEALAEARRGVVPELCSGRWQVYMSYNQQSSLRWE